MPTCWCRRIVNARSSRPESSRPGGQSPAGAGPIRGTGHSFQWPQPARRPAAADWIDAEWAHDAAGRTTCLGMIHSRSPSEPASIAPVPLFRRGTLDDAAGCTKLRVHAGAYQPRGRPPRGQRALRPRSQIPATKPGNGVRIRQGDHFVRCVERGHCQDWSEDLCLLEHLVGRLHAGRRRSPVTEAIPDDCLSTCGPPSGLRRVRARRSREWTCGADRADLRAHVGSEVRRRPRPAWRSRAPRVPRRTHPRPSRGAGGASPRCRSRPALRVNTTKNACGPSPVARSGKTIWGALRPSSAATSSRRAPARRRSRRPWFRNRGTEALAMAGWSEPAPAGHFPRAHEDHCDAVGQARLSRDFGEPQRGRRAKDAGLDDGGGARRDRHRDPPRGRVRARSRQQHDDADWLPDHRRAVDQQQQLPGEALGEFAEHGVTRPPARDLAVDAWRVSLPVCRTSRSRSSPAFRSMPSTNAAQERVPFGNWDGAARS